MFAATFRFLLPPVVLCVGLALLNWLHSFRDRAAHNAILPALLPLLVIVSMLIKSQTATLCTHPRYRLTAICLHAVISVALLTWFLLRLVALSA